MGLKRFRVDSIKELRAKKTNEQLTKENEELRAQLTALSDDLVNTQLALCDVYEMMTVDTAVKEE